MLWTKLIETLPIIDNGGNEDPVVRDVSYDSRTVMPGSVFVAISGYKADGDRYIDQAIKNGAVAIVSAKRLETCLVPWIQVENPRQFISILAKKLWGIHFHDMITVGITGTNGKTTTVGLYHALFKTLNGKTKSWMFSTVVYSLGEQALDASKTTPEASDLLRFINTTQNKPEALSMEVSSHALELHRVDGFVFDLAVWTNLTQDHLDFHGDMETYYEAKKKLFVNHLKENGVAVINIDDTYGKRLNKELSDTNKITYGYSNDADVRVTHSQCTWKSTLINVAYKEKKIKFRTPLVGKFNVYNMAALIAGGLGLQIQETQIQSSLESMEVIPGRMECVNSETDFTIVVDYAHTPDALRNVLATAQNLTQGKLICVFGCGGDRDKAKRPLMAEAVSHNCDEAIVTTDNPRTEIPEKIIEDIVEGMPLDFPYNIEPDRREAIKQALVKAQRDDCIIIAGKGHETYQEIDGVRHHFDDREVVIEVIKELELDSENK